MYIQIPEGGLLACDPGMIELHAWILPMVKGLQAVGELNLQTGNATNAELLKNLGAIVSCTSPVQFVALYSGVTGQLAGTMTAYIDQMSRIASDLNAEWQSVVQAQYEKNEICVQAIAGSLEKPVSALSAVITAAVKPVLPMVPVAEQHSRETTDKPGEGAPPVVVKASPGVAKRTGRALAT